MGYKRLKKNWRGRKKGSVFKNRDKTLFGQAKHEYLADLVSFRNPESAEGASKELLKQFREAKTREKKVRIKKAVVQAQNRALASAKRLHLSPQERKELIEISKIYEATQKKMVLPVRHKKHSKGKLRGERRTRKESTRKFVKLQKIIDILDYTTEANAVTFRGNGKIPNVLGVGMITVWRHPDYEDRWVYEISDTHKEHGVWVAKGGTRHGTLGLRKMTELLDDYANIRSMKMDNGTRYKDFFG